MSERAGRAWERVSNEPYDARRAALQLVVAPDAAEPQQHEREHRVPRGRRVVVELLLARDEPLGVVGREVEAAALLVGEQLDRKARQPVCLEQPAQLARGDVQLVEAV